VNGLGIPIQSHDAHLAMRLLKKSEQYGNWGLKDWEGFPVVFLS